MNEFMKKAIELSESIIEELYQETLAEYMQWVVHY